MQCRGNTEAMSREPTDPSVPQKLLTVWMPGAFYIKKSRRVLCLPMTGWKTSGVATLAAVLLTYRSHRNELGFPQNQGDMREQIRKLSVSHEILNSREMPDRSPQSDSSKPSSPNQIRQENGKRLSMPTRFFNQATAYMPRSPTPERTRTRLRHKLGLIDQSLNNRALVGAVPHAACNKTAPGNTKKQRFSQ